MCSPCFFLSNVSFLLERKVWSEGGYSEPIDHVPTGYIRTSLTSGGYRKADT